MNSTPHPPGLARTIRWSVLTFSMIWSVATSAQVIEPVDEEKTFVDSVKKSLSPCFRFVGVPAFVPEATKSPPADRLLASVLLKASGSHVSDGYAYLLQIDRNSRAAYVIRFGGFAGEGKTYGPLPVGFRCE